MHEKENLHKHLVVENLKYADAKKVILIYLKLASV